MPRNVVFARTSTVYYYRKYKNFAINKISVYIHLVQFKLTTSVTATEKKVKTTTITATKNKK